MEGKGIQFAVLNSMVRGCFTKQVTFKEKPKVKMTTDLAAQHSL